MAGCGRTKPIKESGQGSELRIDKKGALAMLLRLVKYCRPCQDTNKHSMGVGLP